MKTIIIYASKHGTTKKSAELLAKSLSEDVILVNAVKDRVPNLQEYDQIIIGGSIHMDKIQSQIRKLCDKNKDLLMRKRVGIFICCGGKEVVDEQMKAAFDSLYEQAHARGYFGYEYDLSKMGFLSRMVVKNVGKVKESQFAIEEENIKNFATKMLEKM